MTNYPNNAKSLSALVTEQVPKVALLPRGVPLVKMQDANARQNHALVMLNDSTRNFLFCLMKIPPTLCPDAIVKELRAKATQRTIKT